MDEELLADLDDLGDVDSVAESEHSMEDTVNLNDNQPKTVVFKSKRLDTALEQIKSFSGSDTSRYNSGPVEQIPEYPLIVEAMKLVVELEYEMADIHKQIQDLYAPKFAELESSVPNPVQYAQVVKMIGNETDMTKLNLNSLLPSATVMAITLTSTTTRGRQLTEEELEQVFDLCDTNIEMYSTKKILLDYVSSRMTLIAPNLSKLLGTSVSSKLMGHAGGLTALSKIPACNLLVLGAEKKADIGLSRVSMGKHMGFIYECDLVKDSPSHITRKAARLLSAKCALACRIDLSKDYPDGNLGSQYREEVSKKIALLIEPPPAKKVKALPLPIEFKKKRGGKRARREKERLGASDYQKAANRMEFGKEEKEVMTTLGESVGLGLLGGNTGKLRLAKKDFKIPLAKKYKSMNFNNNPSGLSSVAFTPVKGIELENPEASKKKIEEANDRYFSSTTFRPPSK